MPNLHRAGNIVFLYAVPDEARFFGDRFVKLQVGHDGSVDRIGPIPETVPADRTGIFSLCIGIGPENATRNTSLLLNCGMSIRAIIVVGFSGGLAAGIMPGSLIVAHTVVDVKSNRRYFSDPRLFAAATNVEMDAVPTFSGLCATTDRVLVLAADKSIVAESSEAVSVDMESAAVAEAATSLGVPWLAVRVITDAVNDDLPLDFNALANKDGSVNLGRIVRETLSRPVRIPALIQLGVRSQRAARNLGAFLNALAPHLVEC